MMPSIDADKRRNTMAKIITIIITRSFPYGLYKVENLVSVIVALAIFYAGYEITLQAIQSSASSLQNIGVTIACVFCAMVITFGFSRYEAGVGAAIESPSLIADAQHMWVDMLANSRSE